MALEAFKKLVTAPSIKLAFNIGCTFDIPTHTTAIGKYGETYVIGGRPEICSVTGTGNTFKTAISNYLNLGVLDGYLSASGIFYDTENTLTYSRLRQSMQVFDKLRVMNPELEQYNEEPRLMLIRGADMSGDEFFEVMKEVSKEREKMSGKRLRTTPFFDGLGNPMRVRPPMLPIIDSISMFQVDAVNTKIYEGNALGESGGNTGFMKDGAAKAQLFIQLPNVTSKGGLYFGMVAHVGNTIVMDKYAPQQAKLTFAKHGMKLKGVPEKFSFINDWVIDIQRASPLLNPTTKSPEFPLSDSDRDKGSDLFLLNAISTRNKSGPSGVPYNIIVSQSSGVQNTLTEFYNCKENGRFGLQGNNTSYQLVLRPEVNLGRTTVRGKIKEDPLLRTAMRMTSELLQLHQFTRGIEDLLCTPEELYNDLKNKGYDWELLLNTDYRWKFVEDRTEEDLPFLSIYDLLNMRKGTYHPHWYPNDPKLKI